MNTPWGPSQHVKSFGESIFLVETASHGGILIDEKVARKKLSFAARTVGKKFGRYLAFEEDLDAQVIIFELEEVRSYFLDGGGHRLSEKDPVEIDKEIIKTLSTYRPEYLAMQGIAADPEGLSRYERWLRADMLRKEQSPDLIRAAWGSWLTKKDGVTLVETADGKYHQVTDQGYQATYKNHPLQLLSDCEVIARDVPRPADAA